MVKGFEYGGNSQIEVLTTPSVKRFYALKLEYTRIKGMILCQYCWFWLRKIIAQCSILN